MWPLSACFKKSSEIKDFSSARFPGLLITTPGPRKTALNHQGIVEVDISTDTMRFHMLFSRPYQTVYAQIVLLCVYALEQAITECLILHIVDGALENRFLHPLSVAQTYLGYS